MTIDTSPLPRQDSNDAVPSNVSTIEDLGKYLFWFKTSRYRSKRSCAGAPYPRPLPARTLPGSHYPYSPSTSSGCTTPASQSRGSLPLPSLRDRAYPAFCTLPRVKDIASRPSPAFPFPKCLATTQKSYTISAAAVRQVDASGSFSVTASATVYLQSIVAPSSSRRSTTPEGFSDCSESRRCVSPIERSPSIPWPFPHTMPDCGSPTTSNSPPSSIPSITRTGSFSSSDMPDTPSRQSLMSRRSSHGLSIQNAVEPLRAMSPLVALESKSKLRVRSACTVCKKPGSNFPRCGKCGDAWCSRDCRLSGKGGKKHVCSNGLT